MDYESSIIDFLKKKENLRSALAVARHIEILKDQLHRQFWTALGVELEKKLKNFACGNAWKISLNEVEKLTQNSCGVSFEPCSTQQLYLVPSIQQERQNKHTFRIFYGIKWNPAGSSNMDIREVLELRDKLKNYRTENRWWLGWKWTDIYPRSENFLSNMVENKDGLIKKTTDDFWELFENQRHALEIANKALANNH